MLCVRLLVADPDLGAGIPADQYATAVRRVVLPAEHVQPGAWRPTRLAGAEGVFALVVADGVIAREHSLQGRRWVHLLGPGDILWSRREADGLLLGEVTWKVMRQSTVIALGTQFSRAARHWPSLGENITVRALAQADRMAEHAAIMNLARAEDRVLAILWHLAERWGRVTPASVVVALPMTHAELGRLVGAQRSTVSLALARLEETGVVARHDGGGWELAADSRGSLGANGDGPEANGAHRHQADLVDVAAESPAECAELLPG